MLNNAPFGVHMDMILVSKEARHIGTSHLFIYQEAFCAAISRECLDEQLLDTCFLHLLEGYADLLCFGTTCCIQLQLVIGHINCSWQQGCDHQSIINLIPF